MSAALNYDRVTTVVGDAMAADPAWVPHLEHNRLAWALEGWTPDGWATVSVIFTVTGETVAMFDVHRSALV